MLRDYLKGMLGELFDDQIKTMSHDYIERKVGDTIEMEIKDALAPSIAQITKLNSELTNDISDIRNCLKEDINQIKKIANDSLCKIVETLPEKLGQIEIDISGVSDALNNRINNVVTNEINKSDGNYGGNIVVRTARKQFGEFVEGFDFMESIRTPKGPTE